ncbi:ergot alkaloid biosynthesis protein [Verrucosispora sp. SN26_14.1]|uniref:NmrA family NAD(P)-binding protein n=1 Tax=Verrucosispora sp. SN26_14.1 TaxID=2527879 RepID=UPI00103345BD|nr:NmrA family NAD(P)-binding protein [Verrucosispora sp. SN26_14.1]TBL43335.1 ergot alkaloid biosynthesis protein [Verrucosispora sp. SN26_14.1]
MSALVIGGTGTTGSRIVARLASMGVPARVASRTAGTSAADGPAVAGQERTYFDWYAPQSWDAALHGATSVYLVPPIGALDPAPVMVSFLERARDAGVRRAVLLGSSAISRGGEDLGRVMTEMPGLIETSVVLRPSWFMSNVLGAHIHAATIREQGEIVTATGDGRIAFVDPDDIATVAVRALTGEPTVTGELVLTGPTALTWDEVAALLSERLGRPVTHRAVGVPQMATHLAERGLPVDFARLLAELDAGIAQGAEDRVTDVVERLTGREPRDFREFLSGYLP